MCIEKRFPGLPTWEEGYKVFRCYGGNLYSELFDMENIRPANKWIRDEKKDPIRCDIANIKYEAGFHVFKTRYAAIKWLHPENKEVIRKVKVRKPTAHGLVSQKIVGVFKEMFILEEVV